MICQILGGGAIGPPGPFVPSSLLGVYVIMYVGHVDGINQKEKKSCFLKSKKIGKKIEKVAAAYDAERPLLLDSFLKLKIHGL